MAFIPFVFAGPLFSIADVSAFTKKTVVKEKLPQSTKKLHLLCTADTREQWLPTLGFRQTKIVILSP